jgi:hypothetical protein
LDVAKNPEEERVRSESRMAEETEPTSEIIFQTGGAFTPTVLHMRTGRCLGIPSNIQMQHPLPTFLKTLKRCGYLFRFRERDRSR